MLIAKGQANMENNHKLLRTELFLTNLLKAFNSYELNEISDLLADDVVYESYFGFSKIIGKQRVINYWISKLTEMKISGHKERLELLYNVDTFEQMLIFVDKPIPKISGEYVCIVAETNDSGLIQNVRLTLTSFYDGLFMAKNDVKRFRALGAE